MESQFKYENFKQLRRRDGLYNCNKYKYIKFIFLTVVVLVLGIIIGLFIPWNKCSNNSFNNYKFSILSGILQKEINYEFMVKQLRLFAAELHSAGSIRNLKLADEMVNNWKNWGLESTKIMNYKVNKTVVNSSNPNIVRLWLNDKIVFNITTVEMNNSLPLYHSYSIGGRAKGRFVFINYGLISDLNALNNSKIEYCGSDVILITRLGFSTRSAKVKNLMKKCGSNLPGGLLVYPDPWDFAVDPNINSSNPNNTAVYPNSWWLPGDAAVFGNFKMISDLQNPDLPSLGGIFETVDFSKMQTLIPVQPISYNDAGQLFQYMNHGSIPEKWGNCLPKYLESSPNYQVEMILNNQVDTVTMANVIGMLPGTSDNDRYIIIGNHRDAWAMGASDPVSGTVILQQVAFILGNAYKKGLFRPFRSILFANWDGEEEGLIGSTEFTNQFNSDLLERCVAYINMDCPIKGNWSFNGRATPLMIGSMLESSKNVWINSSTTLYEDWREKMPNLSNKNEPIVRFLGGGSDHIPFAYVRGIPSAYPEYKYKQSLANMPAYHTRYDSIDMMLKFVDPQLQHHKIVSQFVLDYVIRLSYSPVIPFSIDRLTDLLISQFPDLQKKINSISYLNESNYSGILYDQLLLLKKSGKSFIDKVKSKNNLIDNLVLLRKVNDILLLLPRMFLTREGLPTRPYLKNILLSTRLKNSYLGSVFTGVYDAIDLFHGGKIDFNVVLRQLSLLSDCLRKSIDLLDNGCIIIDK